jgi:DNA-binding PadR family transcriptional regulator
MKADLSQRQRVRLRAADMDFLAIMASIEGDVTILKIVPAFNARTGRRVSQDAAYMRMTKLEGLGLIRRVGATEPPRMGRPFTCYALTSDGRAELNQ